MLDALVDLGGGPERARRREALTRRIDRVLAPKPARRLSPPPLLVHLAPRRLGLVRSTPCPLDPIARRVARFARGRAAPRAASPTALRDLSRRRLGLVRDTRPLGE